MMRNKKGEKREGENTARKFSSAEDLYENSFAGKETNKKHFNINKDSKMLFVSESFGSSEDGESVNSGIINPFHTPACSFITSPTPKKSSCDLKNFNFLLIQPDFKINFNINDIFQKSFVSLFFISFILIIIGMNFISADTLYWVGVNNGNWSDASNWALSSGGAGGAGAPTQADRIIFDSANKNNSIINNSIAVYSINVSIGYNGTITQMMNWNLSLNVTQNVIISNGTLTHGDNSNAETYRVNMIVGG